MLIVSGVCFFFKKHNLFSVVGTPEFVLLENRVIEILIKRQTGNEENS